MIQWILFRCRLARIEWDRSQAREEHRIARKKAAADPNCQNMLQGLDQDHYFEITMIDSTRADLVTRRLLSIAYSLMLPVPQGENWEKCPITGYRILTDEGIHVLRSAIREEKKARREAALSWLAPVTGFIGALTGLAAVVFGAF